MALIQALLSQLLAHELKAWSPRIVQYLIDRAVARLPEEQRPRYTEEWASHTSEIPGEVGKLITAIGFQFAARRMADIDSGQTEWGDIAKRFVDVIVSASLLIAQLPNFLLFALLIRITSTRPIIVTEKRVGLGGRQFKRYKFGGSGRLKVFLKRSHFAQLPQLVNVLLGEMTLVGPDADMPYQAEVICARIPDWKERTSVKPGITGFAKTNAEEVFRSGRRFNAELDFDLHYIKNRTFSLDLYILWRTLLGLFRRPILRRRLRYQ